MEGAKRLQFSMFIQRVEDYDVMSKLPTVLLPLIWVDEGLNDWKIEFKFHFNIDFHSFKGVALNRTYTDLLRYQLFL